MKLRFVHFPERNVWRIARRECSLFRFFVPRWVWVNRISVQSGTTLHGINFVDSKEIIAEFASREYALEYVKMYYLPKRSVKETKDEEWVVESEITIK